MTIFVTGTDTEVGKTWSSLALMQDFKQAGFNVAGMKPIAAGCDVTPEGLRNDDACRLQTLSDFPIDYDEINPYAFKAPVSPHAAAKQDGLKVDLEHIEKCFNNISSRADIVVVEGAGGWRVPLADNIQTVDLVRKLGLPVVLTVGLRLGCINHALLTAQTILADGLELKGWIANQVDKDYAAKSATMDYLKANMACPLIGSIPYLERFDPNQVTGNLNVKLLLNSC